MKKTFANIAFLILLAFAGSFCYGQSTDSLFIKKYEESFKRYKKLEFLTGFNWQGNWNDDNNDNTLGYVEIGIAKSIHNYSRHGPASFGVYASEEIYFGDQNIYGTKIGAYTHYLFDIGFSAIYYTDFKKGNFKLRPELGIGMGGLRIVMGYNIPTIYNRDFEKIRRKNAQVTIQLLLGVKKKAIKQQGSIFQSLFKKEH